MHTPMSLLLSVVAFLVCLDSAVSWNGMFLEGVFGAELGRQLTYYLFPLWAFYLAWVVPRIMLLEPVDN